MTNPNIAEITRRAVTTTDKLALPFAQKLWLLVNDRQLNVCKWSRNGTAIRVRIDLLDDYLANAASAPSIFRTQQPCLWLRHLTTYGFQQIREPGAGGSANAAGPQSAINQRASFVLLLSAVSSCMEDSDNVLDIDVQEYRHEAFRRDRPHLLRGIRRVGPRVRLPADLLRDRDDVRRREPLTLSNARLWLTTLLSVRVTRTMLAHELARCKRVNDFSVIQLSDAVFENPSESMSCFEQGEVAGYYGDGVDVTAVKRFFGEFVPTYTTEDGDLQQQQQQSGGSAMATSSGGASTSAAAAAASSSVVPTAISSAAASSGAAVVGNPNETITAQSAASSAFAIPQFQIVHNAGAVDPSQPYLLQYTTGDSAASRPPPAEPKSVIVCSDYGAQAQANINSWTPIDYDTAFMSDVEIQRQIEEAEVKQEIIVMATAAEMEQCGGGGGGGGGGSHLVKEEYVMDASMSVSMSGVVDMASSGDMVAVPQPSQEPDEYDHFDIDQLLQINKTHPLSGGGGRGSNAAAMVVQQDKVVASTSSAPTTNDIIEQAAQIDEDFFTEYRDTMDELYDKLLC